MAAPRDREAKQAEGRAPSMAAVAALQTGTRALVEGAPLAAVLEELAGAARTATGADVALIRAPSDGGLLSVRAVAAPSAALAAELTGRATPASELPSVAIATFDKAPPATREAAARARAEAILVVPVMLAGVPGATIELYRRGASFDRDDELVAMLAADHVALALRALRDDSGAANGRAAAAALELAGDALAAGSDEGHTSNHVARLAVDATRARACIVWRADDEAVSLAASHGVDRAGVDVDLVARHADEILRDATGLRLDAVPSAGGGSALVATVQLGEPALGALQLVFDSAQAPSEADLSRLGSFAVRAAHALRTSERVQRAGAELERSRALLAVVGQAIAQLSLAHTLETAIERIAELLDVQRVAVYLTEEGRVTSATGRGLAGPHAHVGERLLELALGPYRGRGVVAIDTAADAARLPGVRDAAAEAGIEAALALPLVANEETIGLLAVYPPRGRAVTTDEEALLRALAVQLAVAVQNARLHEQAKKLGAELQHALRSERQAARKLGALYEISRSFAQSLSLEATLDALARTLVELLGVDVALIRMLDERREQLVTRAIHVADARLHASLRVILARPQPLSPILARRLLRNRRPLPLDADLATRLGRPDSLLVPFLEKGSSAAIVPVATTAEVLATLTLVSLDPARPIGDETIDSALSVAGQAALAIDNARLYQQQKGFSDDMQRSLLPLSRPQLEGLEVGEIYESSARVDVGGDVYDYLTLPDGRLAVVLGDVTGHGIDAAADMAMAKYAFRSLARDHPDPADFLAAVNNVVVGEIETGKFITMVYLTVDGAEGEIACASAGHPPPRMVLGDGSVTPIEARGMALGIDADHAYDVVRMAFPRDASVVLYTDGVVEARRRGGEMYGEDRLDAVLSERRGLAPKEVALAALADCRAWSGGELGDDCALVVIKRTA